MKEEMKEEKEEEMKEELKVELKEEKEEEMKEEKGKEMKEEEVEVAFQIGEVKTTTTNTNLLTEIRIVAPATGEVEAEVNS